LRIEAAKEMVAKDIFSLTAIAESCGFGNLHHFSKMFKKYTGIPPSQYVKHESSYIAIEPKIVKDY